MGAVPNRIAYGPKKWQARIRALDDIRAQAVEEEKRRRRPETVKGSTYSLHCRSAPALESSPSLVRKETYKPKPFVGRRVHEFTDRSLEKSLP